MKDAILILVMLAVFALGWYIMVNVDRFIEQNQRFIAAECRKGQSKIRIAAESPLLLSSIASALESCSRAEPHIAFFLSSGNGSLILKKLMDEQIDIVLLGGDCAAAPERCAVLPIRNSDPAPHVSVLGLPVENEQPHSTIHVVWKKDLSSKDRDRVIFALENEHCVPR